MMKIFSSHKSGSDKSIYFCGVCIYERKNNQLGKIKTLTIQQTKKLFSGFIGVYKTQYPYKYLVIKKIQFFDKSIIKIIKDGRYLTYKLFNIFVIRFSLLSIFKKKYFKYIDRTYQNVIILNGNSGEICVFLKYILEPLLKQHGNFFVIATKKYHIDLIKIIWPNLQFVYIENFHLDIKGKSFNIEGIRFLIVLPTSYFIDFENNLLNLYHKNQNDYFSQLIDFFKLSRESVYCHPMNLDCALIGSIMNKIESIQLNLSKFVFVCPEATSSKLINISFWKKIGNYFISRGYDVCVNLTNKKSFKDFSENGYKICNLSFLETFILAKNAKKIIGLRSGLIDFLVYTKVPCVIFYTSFNEGSRNIFLSADLIKKSFSVSHIPEIDRSKIYEICVFFR